ncbi:MAG: hypothetical protein DRJ51_08835 [Thermoprotei archaeon]|nr:MAG: hypothetical protein DRJ51_08835 [Thermoprotei archaeon]RLF02015.1 MAG: hypothetical protein DRJ59_04720 [Thermoprotei archaeon]
MEEAEGVFVDTNILVSKELRIILNVREPLYITPVVLLEYFNWIVEARNRRLAEGDVSRARGYERLLKKFPELLLKFDIKILEQNLTLSDLKEATNLILKRNADPGDALNAITTKKLALKVLTRDRDWQKLKDYAREVIIL